MNIFLVTSPLQLLNAIEARIEFNCQNNILILREEKTNTGRKQIKSILTLKEWDHIIYLPRRNKVLSTLLVMSKVKKITTNSKIENFFFADYSAWRTNVFLNNFHAEKEIMIDDGVLTLREYESKIKNCKLLFSNKKYNFIFNLLRFSPPRDISPSKRLHIFTIFDLEKSEIPIIKNKLSFIKSKAKKHNNEERYSVFIGQAHVNEKGIRIKDYEDTINYIASKSKIYYFPHRTESKEVERKIRKIKNVVYVRPVFPIEIELMNKNINIKEIYGIGSTALVTLSSLIPDAKVYNINFDISSYINTSFGENFLEINPFVNSSTYTLIYPKDFN